MVWDESPRKRTLGIRDKQNLLIRDGKKCGNPRCGKKIDFMSMQVGHKKAFSKGGSIRFSNLISLCYECNKLQGTDNWAVFLKKQGVVDKKVEATRTVKTKLQKMTITQLKALAKKHGVTVTGKLVEDWFESKRAAPTKAQYVTKLSKVLKASEVRAPAKSKAKSKVAKSSTKRKHSSIAKKSTRKSRGDDDDFWSIF